MVTIITEKLRNQSLDDVKVETVPALQTANSNTWAFTTSPSSAFQVTGSKGWTMFLDAKDKWPAGQPTPGTTAKTTATAAGPALTGGAASRGQAALYAHPQTSIQVPSCPTDNAKFSESCAELESIPSTPPAPPLKRHCRSLSIPSDRQHKDGAAATTTAATSAARWQPHAGQIWRPVASRPHNNRLKSRGSPLSSSLHHHHHHHHHHHQQRSAGVASRLSPHGPVAAAGAASGIWPLSKSEDFSTPPDSPVPRPASASSGFCDSLVDSSWLEKAAVAPATTTSSLTTCSNTSTTTANTTTSTTTTGNNNNNNDPKMDAFRLRSLSMEEPISRLAAGVGRGAARSMPAIPGSKTNHSTPSSPRRQRVQRCRSQPCVLHDRKCLKRRRDEERPALDFLKMTETAYDYGVSRNSGRCLPQYMRWSRSLASLFTDPQHCVHGLNTIASSPLDGTTLPLSLSSTSSADGHPGGRNANDDPAWSGRSTDSRSVQQQQAVQQAAVQQQQVMTPGCPSLEGACSELMVATGDAHVVMSSFVDSEDACNCSDTDPYKPADGEMFELEMNNDLDLDQIEKD